jgi:16S rRNA pseudouridine516 synthase
VSPPRRGVVLVLHKPTGLSCSHDENEAPLVYDLVPKEFRAARLQSVGRLDRETSGLLLLTDDGALNHRLTAPRRAIPKRYAAGFVGRLPHDAVARFKAGMLLSHDEAPTLPARLRVDSPSDGTSVGRAIVEIEEGRYRQVRRMFAALGTTVVELRRERFGALVLPADLCPGAAREATADEIAAASRAPNDRLSEA